MAHRFFENQMELNGGTNDMFAAWEDAGGITMGHWDYSKSKLWALAQQYVLADNFFMGAFGGSFLNHQYLICACAPTVPAALVTSNKPSVNVLGTANGKGVPQLALNAARRRPRRPRRSTARRRSRRATSRRSTTSGAGDGYRAVNTMQPRVPAERQRPGGGRDRSALRGSDATPPRCRRRPRRPSATC